MMPGHFLKRHWKKLGALLLLTGGLGLASALVILNISIRSIEKASNNKTFFETAEIPPRTVGLVLGCSKTFSNGYLNQYFTYRMDAAQKLFESGKIEYLLVSGDNSSKTYDESSDMKADLVARGIPEDRVFCDYAGFRTLDSIVRANKIFQQTSFTVISQEFHVRRAIYLASAHGLDVQGFCAKDARGTLSRRVKIRELFAKVGALLDVHLLHTEPKFLGPAIPIPLPEVDHQL